MPICAECKATEPQNSYWRFCPQCNEYYCGGTCAYEHKPTCERLQAKREQAKKWKIFEEQKCTRCGKAIGTSVVYSILKPFCSQECWQAHNKKEEMPNQEAVERCAGCGWRVNGVDTKKQCPSCHETFCQACWKEHMEEEIPSSPTERCSTCGIFLWFSGITGKTEKSQCSWCHTVFCPSCWVQHVTTMQTSCPVYKMAHPGMHRCSICLEPKETLNYCVHCSNPFCKPCYGVHLAVAHGMKPNCEECGQWVTTRYQCVCHDKSLCAICYERHEQARKEIYGQCAMCNKALADEFVCDILHPGKRFCSMQCISDYDKQQEKLCSVCGRPGKHVYICVRCNNPVCESCQVGHTRKHKQEEAKQEPHTTFNFGSNSFKGEGPTLNADEINRLFEQFFSRARANPNYGGPFHGFGRESTSGTAYRNAPTKVISAFTVLGLTPTASADEITKRRKQLAKQYHPDAGGSHEKMKEINVAADEALAFVKSRG